MERLLVYDPTKRLGASGAQEVKEHAFFAGIEWDKVMQSEPQFVPQVSDPESTDYFDPRGAIPQLFQDDEAVAIGRPRSESTAHLESSPGAPSEQSPPQSRQGLRDGSSTTPGTEFGTFNFKNLPVLKQANDEVIKKLRTDQMTTIAHALGDSAAMHHRRQSLSHRIKKPTSVMTNFEPRVSIF